jgi:cytochrome P450
MDNHNEKNSATRADGRYDMISHILRAREKDKEECKSEGEHTCNPKNTTTAQTQTETLSDPTISSTVLSYIVAGTDTTATTMSWLTYVLARDVLVQDALREEVLGMVKEYVSEGESKGKSNPILPYDRIRALPYLTAFIREGLRVYPPTSLVLVRVVPEGNGVDDDGLVFQGRHVPSGTVRVLVLGFFLLFLLFLLRSSLQ